MSSDARQRVIEALARRAEAAAPGSPLQAALRQRLAARQARMAAAPPAPAQERRPSPLAALLAELPPPAEAPRLADSQRRQWAQLRLERRLAQPATEPPAPLGPLHAQVLVPRALAQLRALSPAYLQHLVAQIDALSSLLPLAPAETPEPKRRRTATRR